MTKIALTKKYKTYPEYRNSGVDWIGDVPRDWDVQKIVAVFDFPNDKVTEATHEPLSVTYDGIKKQIETAAKVADGSMRKLVRIGDIAINSRSDRKGAVGASEFEGGISLVYNVLRKRSDATNTRYYHHLFRSRPFSEEFYRWGRGIVDDLWTTRASEMKRILVSVPPKNDQDNIADFLDEKTVLIERIIEKKQRLVELLKEKRAAVINHAVTKGLDPKVKMVDSGLLWVGKIPRGWEMRKVRSLLKEHRQGYYTQDPYVEDGIKLLRITDFNELAEITTSECPKVASARGLQEFYLKKGDFVFARTGGAGTFGYVDFDEANLAYASYLIRFRFAQGTNTDFMKWYFFSGIFQKGVQSRIHGGVNKNVHAEDIKAQKVPFPPLLVQAEIARQLADRARQFQEAIEHADASIVALQEFKLSLISHAVTGKIKI